jgi:hypothetical protein
MKISVAASWVVIGASFLLTGCASITSGTTQVVSVDTKSNGEALTGANCRLENGKGVFYVTTPGSVTIHRATDELMVKCEKENLQAGTAQVKSGVKGIVYGNILFGGVIGAVVDVNDGAAFDYPSVISVAMGESTHITGDQTPNQQAVPASGLGESRPMENDRNALASNTSAALIAGSKTGAKLGQSSVTVEKIAKQHGCESDEGAGLISNAGPLEVYQLSCRNGTTYLARCELRQCAPMQ